MEAARLSHEFSARLGGVRADEPGSLLGLEQEFTVHVAGAGRADFRELLDTLPVPGARMDPIHPAAVRTPSGIVVTADGPEAEAATPPIPVQPGCGRETARWASAARREIEQSLAGAHWLRGYSTHLSVATDTERAPRLAALYTRTFALGFMLLVDRATSPGLIVRPRVGRTELCGEFVDGPWLRAASVYAAGSVIACRDVLRGERDFSALPPQLIVTTRAPLARPGWFVDRGGFGTDLLRHGRRTVVRRCDGRRIRAQRHLELAWEAARTALRDRVNGEDIAVVDDLVAGTRPLPLDADPEQLDAGEPNDPPSPSPLGRIGKVWHRPAYVVEAVQATWEWTVFRVTARQGGRAAFACIPRGHHERFFAQLDSGALDPVLGGYLDLPASGRPLAMSNTEPTLGDVQPSTAAVTQRDLVEQIGRLVPSADPWVGKDPFGIPLDAPDRVIVPGPLGTPVLESRRGCLPRMRWILLAGAVAAIVIGGLVFALAGGGGEESSTSAPAPSEAGSGSGGGSSAQVACGTGTGGLTIGWNVATQSCGNDELQIGGTYTYPQNLARFRTVTVTTSTGRLDLFFGTTCKIHDASAQDLDNAEDPTNGFRGLSLLGVPISGLPPGAVAEVVLVAPDGQTVRTGRATADSNGYAEVRVPINVPQAHTIRSVQVWPNGNIASTPVEMAPTQVTPDGKIDGTFPGNHCDRAATLAKAASATTSSAALTADEVKQIVVDSASLWPLLLADVGPGDTLDMSKQLKVDGSEGYAEISGFATGFDLWPGTAKGRDPTGAVPAYIDSYGGAVVFPSTGGTADLWDEVFGCGPNQLTFGVCTPAKARLRDIGYLKVGAVFDRPVPVAPSGTATYTFEAGSATVELTARGGKWSLSGPDDARAY